MKKLFRSWPNRILLIVVLIFPFIQMEFGMSREYESERIVKDAIREELKGTINEVWLDERFKEIEAMEEAGIREYDVRYTTIKEAYWDGLRAYETYQFALTDPTTPDIVKQDFLDNPLQAGPYEDWFLLFECFSTSGIVYAVACIYLFCNQFNQEDESGAIELIKSSSRGRWSLALAKVGLCISVCLVVGILVNLSIHTTSRMHLFLAGGDTSLFMIRKPQYLTCEKAEYYYMFLLLLSGCICGISATWLSSLSKKMYVSLALGLLFFILPALTPLLLFDTAFEMFFPVSFAVISRSCIYYPWLSIGDYVQHSLPLLASIWIPVLSLCMLHILWHYCKYKESLPMRKLRKYIWN